METDLAQITVLGVTRMTPWDFPSSMGAMTLTPRFAALSRIVLLTLVCVSLSAGLAAGASPLRLANDEPLVCIYYFPHWWEPWKSSDEAVLRDLADCVAWASTRCCWITSGAKPSMATGDGWTVRTG